MKDQRRELQKHIFAVLGSLAKILGTDSETLRVRMLIMSGRFRWVTMPDDYVFPAEFSPAGLIKGSKHVAVVNSMNSFSMDEDGMRAFWNDMRAIIIKEILPTLAEGDRHHIASLIDGA